MKLSTDRLTPGLYIKLPCSWDEHPFLLNSFQIQDEKQLKIVQSLNINHVIFFPEKSNASPLPSKALKTTKEDAPESDDLKALWAEKEQSIEEQKLYIRDFKRCGNQFKKVLSAVRTINLRVINQGPQAVIEATKLIGEIAEKLNSSQNTVLHLMEEEHTEGYNYHNHVLHVAILSMILGKALALPEQDLIYLGLGALFHDLGLSKIPNQIIRNNPQITPVEKNYYKLHVRYTLDKIKNIPDLPQAVIDIISQHHEYLDGSGYPEKLRAEQISLLTQIVTIADKYDSLCNPSNKYPARTPYHALSHLYTNRSAQLNKKVLGLLIKELGIYPPGCIVQLCNQKYALVMSVTKSNILQPSVLIYDPAVPKKNAPIISLSKEKLKIEKVISASQLPADIREYLTPRTRINYYFEYAEKG
ncbi:MAG: DUF3391 domain-containing protein [Psychromonas sp.]|nr:DUF3391 domain-containing protein [Psychromonas sp.]